VVVIPDEALSEGLRTGMDTRQDQVVDTNRNRHELGYAELTSREEALRRSVTWARQQGEND
jgi:nucleoside-diphosphate-sugar epimerase